jgi:hypothetical protein
MNLKQLKYSNERTGTGKTYNFLEKLLIISAFLSFMLSLQKKKNPKSQHIRIQG